VGGVGVVALPGRAWRTYAGPVAFLLVATIAVALVRGELRHHGSPGGVTTPAHITRPPAKVKPRPSVYVVRAGDTIDAIAAKTKVPAATLLRLNPRVSPTALFIGEKIQLR
jgi:LysM repeat protein